FWCRWRLWSFNLEVVWQPDIRWDDPDLTADDSQLLYCHRVAPIHEVDGRLAGMLDVAGDELLCSGSWTGQLAADHYLAAQSPCVHHSSHHGLAGFPEVPAPFQG